MKATLRARALGKKFTLIFTAYVLAVSSLTASVPFILSSKANAVAGISTSATGNNLQAAVALAAPGDTILVDADLTVSASVVISKPLTIQGVNGATVEVSKVNQLDAISIQSSNVTVRNLNFKSTWDINNLNDYNNVVVRALAVSPSYTNILITGNSFTNVRQPAYLGESSTGTVSNNLTSGTKGWVAHASSDYNFTANTWGVNVLDIAILPSTTNNYSDARVVQLSDLNNNATVERQTGGVKVLSDAYVSPVAGLNAGRGDDGSKWNPYTNDIQSALGRIVEGGTVHLADGDYTGTVNILKNGTKLVGDTNSRDTVKIHVSPLSGQAGIFANSVSNITIKNLGVFGDSFASNGALIKLNDGTNANIENVVVKNAQASKKVSGIDINSYSNVIVSGVYVAGMTKDGVSVTARQNTSNNVSKNITIQNSAISNAAWSAVAFYTKTSNGYTDNISGVTLSNVSTQYGDRGVYVDGAGGTVTSPSSTKLVLQNVTVGQHNNEYINNEQSAGVDARTLKVNIGGGVVVPVSAMDQTQYDAVLAKTKDKYNKNQSALNYGFVQLIDVAAPVLSLKTANGKILTSGSVTKEGNVVAEWTKPIGGTKYIYKYWNNIPGNPWTAANPYTPPTLTDLSRAGAFTEGNGTHYIQVIALDMDGNQSSGSNIFEVTYDTKAPTASGVTVNPGVAKRVDGTAALKLTVKDEHSNIASAKYTLYNDATDEVIAKNVEIAGNYGSREAVLNAPINISGLAKGTYRVQLHFNDAAGNQGKATTKFVIDNDDVSTRVAINTINTSTNTPTISGSVVYNADTTKPAAGQPVQVEIGTLTYNTSTDVNGAWSVTTDALNNDDYVVFVTVGNPSNPSGMNAAEFTINIVNNEEPVDEGEEGEAPAVPQTPAGEPTTDPRPTTTTPSITGPSGLAAILGVGDANANNTDTNEDADVQGISTANTLAAAAGNTDGKAFGLAWYWWLLIIAAVAGVIWWLVGAVRRRQAE